MPVARPEVTGRRRLTTTAPTATVEAITTDTTSVADENEAQSPTSIRAQQRKLKRKANAASDPLALIGKQDLAALLDVDPWTVDRWRRPDEDTYDPTFPEPIWISGATPRWRRVEIEAWLADRPHGGLSPNWTARPRTRRRRRASRS